MLNASILCNLAQILSTSLDRCKCMLELKQIHALLIVSGLFEQHGFASNVLSFSAISDSGDIDYSDRVFLQLSNPTIFNWNTIVRGYSKSRNPNRSISVFIGMQRGGVSPDYLTYPFLVKASARLSEPKLGAGIHGCIAKTGFVCDRFIQNSLIHMYASCGEVVSARKVFEEMPNKNLVSWNSMLDGYAKCGNVGAARKVFDLMPERDVVSWSSLIDGYVKGREHSEALNMFEKMELEGCKPNEVTMVSVLCACAHLGALEQGKKMHLYMNENNLPLTLVLRTSLVDMYAKCGAIDDALFVFNSLSLKKTDVLIWNAMIGGLSTHGYVKESLDMFTKMQLIGINPDEITYLCLLSACAHGGLVKEAWLFFDRLSQDFQNPKNEHYACMIDVLAKAGQLTEAYRFLCQMPVKPTGSMLGALLSGCINHRKLDLAEIVGKKLIEMEPDHDGRYVGLSNAYAIFKRWDEVRNLRDDMERRGVNKSPGWSFVEIFSTLHKFIAHDNTHPCSERIYAMLKVLLKQMKVQEDCPFEIEDIQDV